MSLLTQFYNCPGGGDGGDTQFDVSGLGGVPQIIGRTSNGGPVPAVPTTVPALAQDANAGIAYSTAGAPWVSVVGLSAPFLTPYNEYYLHNVQINSSTGGNAFTNVKGIYNIKCFASNNTSGVSGANTIFWYADSNLTTLAGSVSMYAGTGGSRAAFGVYASGLTDITGLTFSQLDSIAGNKKYDVYMSGNPGGYAPLSPASVTHLFDQLMAFGTVVAPSNVQCNLFSAAQQASLVANGWTII